MQETGKKNDLYDVMIEKIQTSMILVGPFGNDNKCKL